MSTSGEQSAIVPFEIRPLAEDEIGLLERYSNRLPYMPRHRFDLQQAGKLLYLIAWQEGELVGHVLLEWGGTSREAIVARLGKVATLTDFFVRPEYRSRGIGSQRFANAERLLRAAGHTRGGPNVAPGKGRGGGLGWK